jgi:anti-sigma factor RsiW
VSRPCGQPLADEALLGWWSGELSGPPRGALERHLLSCDACSARAGTLVKIAAGVRALVREGELQGVVPPGVVERLRDEGLRIREYRVAPGAGVHCSVAPEDAVVLARLSVDLAGVTRLDLALRVDDGPEQRLTDLPFDASVAELVFAPSLSRLRAQPAHVERLRLLAVAADGERSLGEYTFDHTPWPEAPS